MFEDIKPNEKGLYAVELTYEQLQYLIQSTNKIEEDRKKMREYMKKRRAEERLRNPPKPVGRPKIDSPFEFKLLLPIKAPITD